MTKEEILGKAKYIQFPLKPTKYKVYPTDIEINKLPMGEEYMYLKWDKNHNHFRTSYHREFVLPLVDKLFSIGIKMEDFNIVERFEGEFDISMPYPKKDVKFDVYSFKKHITEENLTYNDLLSSNTAGNWVTEYHKLYRYPHESSIVFNKGENNGKRLFIIGDSQMIPDIGPLSYYYKEVWYMDNRDRVHVSDKYDGVFFDDVLFELNCSDISKHITDVFM